MRVQLMLTCLCDAFFGEVGIATVRVLEHAGCRVEFPEEQTCCGQPPFNAGDWASFRRIADHCITVFDTDDIVVTPSSSCAAMMRHGYEVLYKDRPLPRVMELSEFLLDYLEIDRWPLRGSFSSRPLKIAFHRACHGRVLHLGDRQERLMCMLPGVELMPFGQGEQCCGFGGAFSTTHSKISSDIGLEKVRNISESGANLLVSGDMGCLMHLQGLIKRNDLQLEVKHYAQLLAEVLT